MDRPRLMRGLRIAWTALFCVFGVVLVVLWARSCKILDYVSFPLTNERVIQLISARRTVFAGTGKIDNDRWGWHSIDIESVDFNSLDEDSPFRIVSGIAIWTIIAPHWSVLSLSVVLPSVPWLLRKFSLRTLLI